MKKFYIPLMMVALLATACGHRASNGTTADGDSATVATDATDAVTVDSVGKAFEDSMVSVKVSVEWPSGSNDALVSSIRKYICEELAAGLTVEGKPDVILYKDGNAAVDSTATQQTNNLLAAYQEAKTNDALFDGMQFMYSLHIFKSEETATYVTYLCNAEGFQGGAHGFATSTGMTFSKSDGSRIGYQCQYNADANTFDMKDQTLFSKPDAAPLAVLIKEGVRSYFKAFDITVSSDEQLKEQLIGVNSVDSIPLPNTPPVFTKDGLTFVYQQYEIAPYAAGMINFTIPYDKVRPFLTPEAASLIK